MDKNALQKKLEEHFKWFHRHPELGFEEIKTTGKIREILESLHVEILDTGLKTGIVAAVRGKKDGPVIALRCDIDGLPIAEQTDLPYVSENPGCMHACGHDFHLTAMLGAAMLLKEEGGTLPGTVKLIFQPAEETAGGAVKVIASGVLEDVKEIYGLHTTAELAPGIIGASPGATYAAVGSFTIHIKGHGGHAGYPHLSKDPIAALGLLITAAQTIVSRNANPFDPSVVSITRVEAGNTWNVIPGEAKAEGTIRSLDTEKFTLIAERLGEIVKGVELSSRVGIEYSWNMRSPATDNDPALTAFVAETARELGLTVVPSSPGMGGEDFAQYQQRIKGVFWNIGVGSPEGAHHPRFAVNLSPLSTASQLLALTGKKALNRLALI